MPWLRTPGEKAMACAVVYPSLTVLTAIVVPHSRVSRATDAFLRGALAPFLLTLRLVNDAIDNIVPASHMSRFVMPEWLGIGVRAIQTTPPRASRKLAPPMSVRSAL